MNGRYFKLTFLLGSASLVGVLNCQADQTSTAATATAQGAPVYQSDSGWQPGLKPGHTAKPVNQTVTAQPAPRQLASAQSSTKALQSSDSQTLTSPRASGGNLPTSHIAPYNSGTSQSSAPASSSATTQSSAQTQSQSSSDSVAPSQSQASTSSAAPAKSQPVASSSASTTHLAPSTPMITEGANSGGQWNPALTQQTLVPNAGIAEGWLPGYHNPHANLETVTVREASGAANNQSRSVTLQPYQLHPQQQQMQSLTLPQMDEQQLTQQLNLQQQQLVRLQQQLNTDQHQLSQQDQDIIRQKQDLVKRQQELTNQQQVNKQKQDLIRQQQDLNRQQQELNKKQQQLNLQQTPSNDSTPSNESQQ